MFFSLEKRFLVFLLIPLTLIVGLLAFGNFFVARSYLLDQWAESIQLKLEKAAHQITMELDEKMELINLTAKAQEAPERDLLQAFLIQQLIAKKGVRFVDLQVAPHALPQPGSQSIDANDYGSGTVDGLYTMELCGDVGFCAPITNAGALDRSLRIVKVLGESGVAPVKRLVVRISFDSLVAPIREMAQWRGSIPLLVTSTGQLLAADDKAFADRKQLGDNGDELEKKLLQEMRTKAYGTVSGKGRPPDVIMGFYKVPAINWYIVLISKGSALMAPLVRFRFYSLMGGLAAVVIVFLLVRITTRAVGRSIAEISHASARVREGDYSIILPEDRQDELGELSRNFNRMVEGLKQRDLIQETFGRYVDKAVAEELMKNPDALRLGGEKATVTILMSDLRDFTPLSEKLPPEEVIKLLNQYFARMIAVIERFKGIIVDFYGDSILVFFNGSGAEVDRRALDAIKCGLEMQRDLTLFNEQNRSTKTPQLVMAIGVHTGEVVVGNIGTESRAKYGIVGAAVNLTDRIQASASGGSVVISEDTYQIISKWLTVSYDFRVCLKGVSNQQKLYEVESVIE
ncbi:MAG: adenylate/guanylate cyclase domain-containing protein [Desulfomonilaceae bacterium]